MKISLSGENGTNLDWSEGLIQYFIVGFGVSRFHYAEETNHMEPKNMHKLGYNLAILLWALSLHVAYMTVPTYSPICKPCVHKQSAGLESEWVLQDFFCWKRVDGQLSVAYTMHGLGGFIEVLSNMMIASDGISSKAFSWKRQVFSLLNNFA